MARECSDCHQKPCMGGKGNGSCVSTAGRMAKGSGGTVPRDEEPGTRKNPMIDCPDEDYAEVKGVWHKEHKCQIRVPKLTPSHLQAHRCSCGHSWR